MRRILISFMAVALVTSACSGDDDATSAATEDVPTATASTTTTAPVVEAGALSDRDCGYDPPIAEATCHWLEVPENRAAADGATIRLAVTVLHTGAPDPNRDPVVYLHGGPGGDTVDGARNWLDDPYLESRDVVLWDQRGAGLSEPNLNCPEVDADIIGRFTRAASFEQEHESRIAAMRACDARLLEEGVDLDQYDSEASAADLESLRLTLAVEEWNLLGVSYGTRLALTYMRGFPDHIRSVLLDSVYPTDVGGVADFVDGADRAIQHLVDGCLADTACAAAYPDFASAVDRAYERLNEEPFEGDVDLGEANGGVTALVIDGGDALAGLFTALYDKELIPILPGLVVAIANGDYGLIPAVAQQGIPFATQFADGTATAVGCADNATLHSEADDAIIANPGRYGTLVVENNETYCDIFDVEPAPAAYNERVRSDVPALVLAGAYDPVTPPANSEAAAEVLANATFALVDGVGHGVAFSDDCGLAMYVQFLADPAAAVDTSCAAAHPGPVFSTG